MMISFFQSLLCKWGAQGLKGGQTMPSAKRWAAYAICTFLKQNGMILTWVSSIRLRLSVGEIKTEPMKFLARCDCSYQIIFTTAGNFIT